MTKAIFSLISILMLILSVAVQANCLDEITEQTMFKYPPVKKPLVPAEVRFVEFSETMRVKPNWPEAREALWRDADKSLRTFTNTAYNYLGIPYGELDELNIQELHKQYAELYKLLSAPSPQPKSVMAMVPEQTPRSRSNSADSSLDPSASSLSSSFTESDGDSDGSASAGPQFTDADADNDGPPLGSSTSESDPAEFDNLFTTDGSQPEARPFLRQRAVPPKSSWW